MNGDGTECIAVLNLVLVTTMNVMTKITTLMMYAPRVLSSHLHVAVQLDEITYQFLTVALLVHLQIGQQHHIQQHKSEHVTNILMNVLQLQRFVTEEFIQDLLIMQAHTSANVTLSIHVTAILSLLALFLLPTVKVVSM